MTKVKKGKATIFIHGLCLKLQACGAVYMKQILQIEQKFATRNLKFATRDVSLFQQNPNRNT